MLVEETYNEEAEVVDPKHEFFSNSESTSVETFSSTWGCSARSEVPVT